MQSKPKGVTKSYTYPSQKFLNFWNRLGPMSLSITTIVPLGGLVLEGVALLALLLELF